MAEAVLMITWNMATAFSRLACLMAISAFFLLRSSSKGFYLVVVVFLVDKSLFELVFEQFFSLVNLLLPYFQ